MDVGEAGRERREAAALAVPWRSAAAGAPHLHPMTSRIISGDATAAPSAAASDGPKVINNKPSSRYSSVFVLLLLLLLLASWIQSLDK